MKQCYAMRTALFLRHFLYLVLITLSFCTANHVGAQSVVMTNFTTGSATFARTPAAGSTIAVVKDVNDTTNRVLSFNWTNLAKLTNYTLATSSNANTLASTSILIREVFASVPNAILKAKVYIPGNVLIDSIQLYLRNNSNTVIAKSPVMVLGALYTPGWQTLSLDAPVPAGTILRDLSLGVWGANGTGYIYVDDVVAETTTPKDSTTLWNFSTTASAANNFQRWNTTDNGSHPVLNIAAKDQNDTTNGVLELNWTANNFTSPKNVAIYTGSTANLSNNVLLREVLGSINEPVKLRARVYVPATSVVGGFRMIYSIGGKTLTSDSVEVVPGVGQWYNLELPAFVPSQYPSPKELLFWAYGIDGAGVLYIDDIVVVKEAVTPLQLLQFTVAANTNGKANIAWQTANEVNTAYFDIEQSANGQAFQTIGRISAATAAASTHHYSYTTEKVLTEGVHYFRLKMVDADGATTYSQAKKLVVSAAITLHTYPNPATHQVIVQHPTIVQAGARLQVINQQGQIVNTYVLQQKATSTQFSVNHLPIGTYQLVLLQINQPKAITRLIIQK